MKKLLKYTACLAMLVMVVALFTGCKVTGGGWFMDGENKCTFGLNAQGTEVDEHVWEFKGQFQFQDHGTGVKFHVSEMTQAGAGGILGAFTGMDKDGYEVIVLATDMGEPGPDVGDGILIIHEEYGTWAGFLGGGNIQVHEDKD